jgi:hypothetical protein
MKLIIGTICKNIERNIPVLYSTLKDILEVFPGTNICLYENNSTDNTKNLLKEIKNLSSNIHILCEDYTNKELLNLTKANTWDMKPCRMELIAIARNKLLDMINSIGYEDNDLILMFDSDIVRPFNIHIIKNRIQNFPNNVDVLLANGINSQGNYYDLYALRNIDRPFGPELLGDSFWNLPTIHINNTVKVFSGFAGMGIYKGYCLRNNRYSAIPTNDLDIFNRELVKSFKEKLPTSIKGPCIDGCLVGMYLFGNDGLFYYNNSGYNYPVVCEHSTFHATMYNRGYQNMFIDPELIYYSGH